MNVAEYAEALAITGRLREAGVIREHPGHSPQSVHGGGMGATGGKKVGKPKLNARGRADLSAKHRREVGTGKGDTNKVSATSKRLMIGMGSPTPSSSYGSMFGESPERLREALAIVERLRQLGVLQEHPASVPHSHDPTKGSGQGRMVIDQSTRARIKGEVGAVKTVLAAHKGETQTLLNRSVIPVESGALAGARKALAGDVGARKSTLTTGALARAERRRTSGSGDIMSSERAAADVRSGDRADREYKAEQSARAAKRAERTKKHPILGRVASALGDIEYGRPGQ